MLNGRNVREREFEQLAVVEVAEGLRRRFALERSINEFRNRAEETFGPATGLEAAGVQGVDFSFGVQEVVENHRFSLIELVNSEISVARKGHRLSDAAIAVGPI